jgi:5-methylcytosine-specific restriction enzyme subunit McrC
VKLFEWHSASFESHKGELPAFIEYLTSVWMNRNRFMEGEDELSEDEQQERRLQKQRFFDFTVEGMILARNYVGVVQFEGIRIEIYPKIFSGDNSHNSKLWQLNMLYWLSYCRKIKFPFSFADVSKLHFDDYLELLIYVFANYSLEVLSHQPFQTYQLVEEETLFLKGRLSFDNYLRNNLTTGRWQNFYCEHEPFIYDNQLNRIIKYVTRRLSSISENSLNKEKLDQILFLLHDVTDIPCTSSDCDKVKFNPLFDDHKNILQLCKMYLSNQVIDMESEDSKNFCFLVPMEYIFEDFIFGFISDKWSRLNVSSQSTDFLAFRNQDRVFQIRNDLYIKDQLIIDTKYKVRQPGDGLKSGVNQSDMYQMVSYALRRNCTNVLLLYPQTNSGLNESASFRIPSEMLSSEIMISARNLNITIEELNEADELMRKRISELHPVFNR